MRLKWGAPKEKLERAKELRQRMTPSERRAWALLRNRRCLGLKFRRQRLIDGFYPDFYCPELALVLEIDGDVHVFQAEYDARRTKILEAEGLRVVRIRNEDVSQQTLEEILRPFLS